MDESEPTGTNNGAVMPTYSVKTVVAKLKQRLPWSEHNPPGHRSRGYREVRVVKIDRSSSAPPITVWASGVCNVGNGECTKATRAAAEICELLNNSKQSDTELQLLALQQGY